VVTQQTDSDWLVTISQESPGRRAASQTRRFQDLQETPNGRVPESVEAIVIAVRRLSNAPLS